MNEKDLKNEIDEIEEKIRELTEEKKKRIEEYRRIFNLNEFLKILKENKKRCRRFGIATYCRKSIDDKEHWTHITVDVGDEKIGVDIRYPLSSDFDREFRELIYKYINNSN